MNTKFDGDTASYNVCYSDNAIKETTEFLNSVRAYVDNEMNLLFNPITDTVEYVLHNLTGE